VPNPFLLARERPPPGKLAKRLSTRSVRLARMILIQAIRNAMVNDLVLRNVRIWPPSRGQCGTAV